MAYVVGVNYSVGSGWLRRQSVAGLQVLNGVAYGNPIVACRNPLPVRFTCVLLCFQAGQNQTRLNNLWIKVPAGIIKLFRSDKDWNLETPPNRNLANREVRLLPWCMPP